ncbi:MAG: hypothetical protein GY828_03315 [Candidatus Gracilibacteria bacterium]|nr:hypothetical protein [Candidatus Gracilibacteria bacterium]
MVVTKKGLILSVFYVIIPSVIAYNVLSFDLFLPTLFLIALIGCGVLFYFSLQQEKTKKKFDSLGGDEKRIHDVIDDNRDEKYEHLVDEYKQNQKYIIEKNKEIIIYPKEGFYISLLGGIPLLKLPSYKHKRPILKITLEGIIYGKRPCLPWGEIYMIRSETISTGLEILEIISSQSSIYIPFDYNGMPLRRDMLRSKIQKYITINNIQDIEIEY